jgi:hypothetical protein
LTTETLRLVAEQTTSKLTHTSTTTTIVEVETGFTLQTDCVVAGKTVWSRTEDTLTRIEVVTTETDVTTKR